MTSVNSGFIRTYCLSRFTANYRLSSDGTELIVPSLFLENDYKRHQSVNLNTGLWRCFKTGNKGNFVKLYSILEGCSYREAYERFVFENFLVEDEYVEPEKKIENIDDDSMFEMVTDHPIVASRMLDSFTFYICKEGFYKNRLIIPFFNGKKKMFYFQARALDNETNPKYLNCRNLKSSQVLYPYEYESTEPLFITEGVFDAMSLKLCGLNATTTLSCYTSNEQMMQLQQYRGPLVCSFDSDKAGRDGVKKFLHVAYKHKRSDLYHCLPPKGFKDWNELLLAKGPDAIIEHTNAPSQLDLLSADIIGSQILSN